MPQIEKVLPTPEKFASCPDDGNILEYYAGHFENVYVMLHPFIKSTDIDWQNNYPSKEEQLKKCQAVTWQEILKLSPFKNIAEIDVALRSHMHALRKEYHNEAFVEYLTKLFAETDIVEPEEGDIPPLLENKLYDAIKKLGYNWLWVGTEFADERKLRYIDDLKNGDFIPPHGCIFTHDHSVLVTTHWDSHCSFLCSSQKIIKEILSIDLLEGFYCSADTQVYWGLHS